MLSHAYRTIFLTAALIAMLPSAPSLAVTAKEKMATCKFGADDQKLQGAARAKFYEELHGQQERSARPRGGRCAGVPAAGAAQAARRRRSNNRKPSRSRGAPNADGRAKIETTMGRRP